MFGVSCEALPRQVNFLTDEAGECGKGANAVISRVHYLFEHHGFGEKNVYLHADNCTGQNKNNCMIHYLLWRTLTNRHQHHSVIPSCWSHKFSPDWCFGLFKRLYRRTKVGSLQSIFEVVNDSAECNFAQLVSREDGSTIVPTFDWTDLFAPHMKIVGIKKLHHFRMTSASPGCVFVREHIDSAEVTIKLLKEPAWTPDVSDLPNVPPHGLSAERQWYLHEQIRPFCPDQDKDSVHCHWFQSLVEVDEVRQSQKRIAQHRHHLSGNVCGMCHQEGHDRRRCPNK